MIKRSILQLPLPTLIILQLGLGRSKLGSSSYDIANGVATDSSGNVYLTGYTEGGLDGNTSAGSSDLFVVKYNSSGTKQ